MRDIIYNIQKQAVRLLAVSALGSSVLINGTRAFGSTPLKNTTLILEH